MSSSSIVSAVSAALGGRDVAMANIAHVSGDLMGAKQHTPALCHCVSKCLAMGKGIAVLFKSEFGRVDELKAQNVGIGGVAILDMMTKNTPVVTLSSPPPHGRVGSQQSTLHSFFAATTKTNNNNTSAPSTAVMMLPASSSMSSSSTAPVTTAIIDEVIDVVHHHAAPPTTTTTTPTTTTHGAEKDGSTAITAAAGPRLRYVYYLITKERYNNKPTYNDLRLSLRAMFEHMVTHGVPEVAMPEIGCGLDQLQWEQVEVIIREEMKRAVENVSRSQNDNVGGDVSGARKAITSSLLSTVYHYKPPAGSPAAVGGKRLRGGRGAGDSKRGKD